MMILNELSEATVAMSGVYGIILLTFAVFVFISALNTHMKSRYKAAALLCAILCAAVLYEIGELYIHRFSGECSRHTTAIISELPAAELAAVFVFFTAVAVMLHIHIIRTGKTMITEDAIREGMDILPDGICFSDKDGCPLLVNTQMNMLCGRLLGSEIMNAEIFMENIRNAELEGNARRLRTQPAVTVKEADGQVWDFRYNTVMSGNSEITEIIAHNVTEQARLNRELSQRNRKLSEVNERLRSFNSRIEALTREKEILRAKIKVHDDLGRALLTYRSYMEQPCDERNRSSLLALWKYIVTVMRHEAASEKPEDEWTTLLKNAAAVNVDIAHTGVIPAGEHQKHIIMTALRECLTNTVKHAGGHRIFLEIKTEGDIITARITNDGRQPEREVKEAGGLKNTRRIVEAAGGSMTIESTPRFALNINLPDQIHTSEIE